MTEATKTERLQQLRRIVQSVPEDRLHMRTFSEKAGCGTAYCLAGWAFHDQWMQMHTPIRDALCLFGDGMLGMHDNTWDVLAESFGLSKREANHLFGSDLNQFGAAHDVTREMVLDNIDRLLRGEATLNYAVEIDEQDEDDD